MINGRSLAGKDTLADYLVKEYGFKKVSFAEPIYEIARKYFDMKKKDRKLLQDIGEKFREIDPDIWVKLLIKSLNKHDRYVISDVRRANEYIKCKEKGFIPIRIKSDLNLRIERCKQRDGIKNPDTSLWENKSETGADSFNYYEIENNSTLDNLHEKIDNLCETLNINKPVNFKILDRVKVKKIADDNKAKHLVRYINEKGHIFSYINLDGYRKYKVLFDIADEPETAYFFSNELELIKD